PDFWHCCRGSAKLAKLELILLNLLRQLDATDDHRCGSETLQSQHRAEPLFYAPMILFDGVVQVLTASHSDTLGQLAGPLQIGHCTVRSGIGIQRDLCRSSLLAHCFA